MKLRHLVAACMVALVPMHASSEEIGEPIPIYTENQLFRLFDTNSHLTRVKNVDNCQLVEDIVARATKIDSPAYEFLYGDMLAWGVCVDRDVELGLYYMANAGGRLIGTVLSGWGYQNYGLTGCLWISAMFLAMAYLLSIPLSPIRESAAAKSLQ